MKQQTELEAKQEWTKKGKTYKTKYFSALGELYGKGKSVSQNGLNLSVANGSEKVGRSGRVK